MNKFTKGAIATGAGIVLLLGGAGTFALWNDEIGVDAGEIDSGVLDITSATGGSWTANGSPVLDIADYLIVPGDTLVYTKTLNVVATGDNLEAELSVLAGSITFSDPEIQGALDISLSATGGTAVTDDNGTPADPTDDFTTIASSASSQAIVVTVTVDFPSSVTDQVAQDQSVDLTSLDLYLEQV